MSKVEWTNRKPFVVNKELLATFKKAKKTLHCGFCMKNLKDGDGARWVFTNRNGLPRGAAGNPFVCSNCENSDEALIEKRVEMYNQFKHLSKEFKNWGQPI